MTSSARPHKRRAEALERAFPLVSPGADQALFARHADLLQRVADCQPALFRTSSPS
jgi:hypothetical protein